MVTLYGAGVILVRGDAVHVRQDADRETRIRSSSVTKLSKRVQPPTVCKSATGHGTGVRYANGQHRRHDACDCSIGNALWNVTRPPNTTRPSQLAKRVAAPTL